MAADYLIAERETLEPERGGKKDRCEKDGGKKEKQRTCTKTIAEKISQQIGQQLKHFMSG